MPVVTDDVSDGQIAFAIEQSNRAIYELTRSSAQRTISDMMDVMLPGPPSKCIGTFTQWVEDLASA